jgi:hypothetical protein
MAINWPNQMEVRLDIRDLDRRQQQFAGCDAVLLTFEMPRETLQHTLTQLNQLPETRPIVIVTPGQPYDTAISGQALSQIDYLVAHAWELGRYAPPEVSRDQEQGNRVVDLAVRAAREELAAQGAPPAVLQEVEERLGRSTGQPAPISRCVVASERGILFDQLARSHRAQQVATWGPLPDVAAWLRDASQQVPFVLALVDHEGRRRHNLLSRDDGART